ncbi:MAG: hypothetical protein HY736_15400 [Verrucomicrobia bacterium]|nr:hypothetical protein [Verrucomicrobiota bacterium]
MRARDLIYDPDSGRNEFALAENILKRATDLAPDSAAAWGASALLNHYFFSRANFRPQRERQRIALIGGGRDRVRGFDGNGTFGAADVEADQPPGWNVARGLRAPVVCGAPGGCQSETR